MLTYVLRHLGLALEKMDDLFGVTELVKAKLDPTLGDGAIEIPMGHGEKAEKAECEYKP